VLFYDKALSLNRTVACASCHQQTQGFGDTQRFSRGFAGGLTTAHAMRLGNVRYYAPGSMFWDKRAATLEAQATQPIQHPVEMGFDAANGGLGALLARLQALPYYPELFTPWRMSVAPMMDWTDRHCRYFHRLLTRHTLLYTEMVTTGALLHGDVAAPPALQRRRAPRGPATGRQRAGRPGALPHGWASSGAMTKSTSTAAAPASGCSAVPLAPA
jgi:hypothetical protein